MKCSVKKQPSSLPVARRFHRLKSLSVVGGFLDGMHIEFADGLNCLIGHRGTGKTSVLEFIRYALDEFPRDDGEARKRVEALVKANLGDGRIRLTLETKEGLEYIVDRTASGEPMVLTAGGQPTDVRINSADIFSADIFSQNEVESIADSPQSQLELIDKFSAPRIAEINRKVVTVRHKLEANATATLAAGQQLEGLADEVGALTFLELKIKALAEAPGEQNSKDVNTAQEHRALHGREKQAVDEARQAITQYAQWLQESIGQFVEQAEAGFDGSLLCGPNGPLLKDILTALRKLGKNLDGFFESASEAVAAASQEVADLAGALDQSHRRQELAFRELIAKHKHATGVATERADLEKKRNELLTKGRRQAELQRQISKLTTERAALAEELQSLWAERFKLRQGVAEWINQGADSPIRVQVDQCGDVTQYQNALAHWMKGVVGQYNVVARKIAQYVPPADLLRMIRESAADELQAQAELGEGQAGKVMEALDRMEVRLALDTVELADLPRIELLDGQEWKNSLQLSTGQKCTAILPILLLESDNPLLVDQPEDNLDNRYIYDTVVSALHRVKDRRQIILITHNPNIPVLGEAASVYVLTSDGERSRMSNQGSVDACKTEIINLLEGGREAFNRRKERYSY